MRARRGRGRGLRWALALVAAAWLGALLAAPAAGANRADHLDAVVRARALVARAQAGDPVAARQAASVLRVSAEGSELEVLDDLDTRPPNLADAAARLDALEAALREPLATPDGPRADREVRSILAEARYQPAGPSLLDIIYSAFQRLLQALFQGAGGNTIVGLVELAIAAAILIAIVAVLARALWSRRGEAALGSDEMVARARAGHSFAEADRLAAEGDYLGAIRALTSAVATTVGGLGTWEASPYTIRELFLERGILESLQPLVVPFEAAAYGQRRPSAASYARAAAAAAPYREPAQEALAA